MHRLQRKLHELKINKVFSNVALQNHSYHSILFIGTFSYRSRYYYFVVPHISVSASPSICTNTVHLASLFKCYIARSSLPVKFRKESSTYFSAPRQKRNFYPPPDSGPKLLKRIAILTSLRLTSPRSSFHYTLMGLEGTKQSVIHI